MDEYKNLTEEELLRELEGPKLQTFLHELIEERWRDEDKDLTGLTQDVLAEVQRRGLEKASIVADEFNTAKEVVGAVGGSGDDVRRGGEAIDAVKEHADVKIKHSQV